VTAARVSKAPATLRYRSILNTQEPSLLLSEEGLEAIHEASLAVLEQTGMDFMLKEARDRLAAAGADVAAGTERVRLDRGLVEDLVRHAPGPFTLHARNPERNVSIGGRNLAFAQVASAPYCSDKDNGRRTGTQEDYRNLIRLAQSFDVIHMTGGYPVEPTDLHASVRHLDCLSDLVKLTDKPFHAYSLGKERNLDALEIVRIGRGVSAEQLEAEPSLFTIINASSPLRYDAPMLQGIIEMSSRNQVVVITPFTLAGAMAPVTIAGALVQQNAEALAGIAFTQLVRPGAPVVYGGFTSNVDMKSGAPAFGTPEYMKAVMAGGQLARRYGLPYRTSNTCAANTLDAQSAYESMMSLVGAGSGRRQLHHACGRLDGGRADGLFREIRDGCRHAANGRRIPGTTRHQPGSAGHGCDCGGRARRPLFWHGAHAVALRDRVLLADAFGLAQFRKLEPCGPADDLRPCQQGVEGNTRRLRSPGARRGHFGRARRLCRQAQAGRRRADRFLIRRRSGPSGWSARPRSRQSPFR
jgi:trimethylamine:corrinoid methyltransferase-like protein